MFGQTVDDSGFASIIWHELKCYLDDLGEKDELGKLFLVKWPPAKVQLVAVRVFERAKRSQTLLRGKLKVSTIENPTDKVPQFAGYCNRHNSVAFTMPPSYRHILIGDASGPITLV